jgi:hypothetical protein
MKKKLEEPSLLNYSGFGKKHNNIKMKGLKWTISALPPNHKKTFTFKVKLTIFSTDFESALLCTSVAFVNVTAMVFAL